MATGQRAFAQKLNKRGAAEVRKQVSSACISDLPKSISGFNLAQQTVPLTDVVEPPDFEEFLLQNHSVAERDPMRHILEYPNDDIEVKRLHRTVRTIAPIIPERGSENDPKVRSIVRCYTSDYTVMNRIYETFAVQHWSHDERQAALSQAHPQEYEIDVIETVSDTDKDSLEQQVLAGINDTPRGSWASSIFDLKNSQADALLPNLLDGTPASEIDQHNATQRQQNRIPALFHLYPLQHEDDMIESREPGQPPSEHFGHRIVVTCKQLKLDMEIEPIFASFSLYDAKEKKKISENFYFDMIQEPVKKMLETHIPYQDVSTLSRSCIFSMTYPSPDIFIVIKLEKVLQQGDISEVTEPYMTDKDKNKEKARQNAALFCERLGKYRMPFAWTAIQLMTVFTGPGPDGDQKDQSRADSLDRRDRSSVLGLGAQYDSFRKRNKDDSFTRHGSLERPKLSLDKRTSWTSEEIGAAIDSFQPIIVTVSSFFKQESDKLTDEDMFKFLLELKKPPSSQKKFKCMPGTLKLDISPCPTSTQYCLTPELYKIDPYPDDKGRPTKEVVEFPVRDIFEPFTVYRLFDSSIMERLESVDKLLKYIQIVLEIYHSIDKNNGRHFELADSRFQIEQVTDAFTPGVDPELRTLLITVADDVTVRCSVVRQMAERNLAFVYPKSLNFSNRQGSARNIVVKMSVMEGEDDCNAMPMIFGKSSCPEFSKEAYTTVTYHNKCPEFYDEIKIRLPAHLTDDHHLLFTFYHVSCQLKTKDRELTMPVETPIGYTWLPLLKEGRLVTGDFLLPVSLEKLPRHYSALHPDVPMPHMKWVDNHKGLFNVEIKAASSIHTLDEHLDHFLRLVHAAEENKIPPSIGEINFEGELKKSITELAQASPGPLIRFLPLILDKLFELMVRPPVIGGQLVNSGQCTFEAIAQIVKRVKFTTEFKNDQHSRNALLVSYIAYSCSLPYPDPTNFAGLSPTYGTLGRPVSLPVNKLSHPRSSSDPDLPIMLDLDTEVSSLMGGRTGSFRQQEMAYYQSMMTGPGKKLVHEELTYQWAVAVGSTRELALSNAWFFFEIMMKSMSEHLARVDHLFGPRKGRFPTQFLEDLVSLIKSIVKDIVERYCKDFYMIRSLNTSFAFFINDCLSVLDRGFVFKMIKMYCKQMCDKISQLPDATSPITLKIEFLRIVCSHEHYVTLNLPFATPLTPSAPSSPCPSIASSTSQSSFVSSNTLMDKGLFMELTNEFRHQHFLVGLALSELSTSLETQNPNLHYRAINLVRNIIASHDCDPRYSEADVKARVATLYLPLVDIILSSLSQLYDPDEETRNKLSKNEQADDAGLDFSVAMAISGSSVYGPVSGAVDPYHDPSKTAKCPLNQEVTRNLLACFLWVLKSADYRILWSWCNDLSPSKLDKLLEILQLCIANFEYKSYMSLWQSQPGLNWWHVLYGDLDRGASHWDEYNRRSAANTTAPLAGSSLVSTPTSSMRGQGKRVIRQYSLQTIKKSVDMKTRLEEAILGSGSARSELMLRRRTTPIPEGTPSPESANNSLRWRKEQTQWRQTLDLERCRGDVEIDPTTEGQLAAEITMIVLDTLELIVQLQSQDTYQGTLAAILRIFLHSLALNQSAYVLQHTFASQRALVSKFPELLFEEETEQCADLCLRLLRHCSSPLSSTRAHASASLYLLMRQNFEIGNNFARVKMQVTMSLSSLVGQNQNFNEEHLRKSLKTILTYAETDVELLETTFPEQVRELVFNLHMILSDTVKMKEFQEDPEMLLDLMYRIAKGYQNSPDLRLTWLQNMAAKHSEKANHAEAAQCLIHSAGLVAEYLNMLEDRPHLPVGCVNFQHVSNNVLEESAVSDDVVSPDEEGICTGKYFSEQGLIGLLEQAVSSFDMAGMYEAMNAVYKVLIPIYEAKRDNKKLASSHGKLQDAFINIVKQEGKRLFGTYFRVGFYGSKFGDLDGEEYIYKEPAITKLPEISHRLESFYTDKLGEGVVQTIKDSNTVEREKQDPDKAYIQITYVEPYFDLYETRERNTYFTRNYNIRRFMYATPFTLDGPAHGELCTQYKRKTILTTSHAFPYVKTRLPVICREQIILSPIEVAIEDIQKKTKELAIALHQEPPDPKMLQMVLQGCIGTTVNQGPVEVASVFLNPVASGLESPSKHHNKLRISFKDFIKKCSDALHKNKGFIGEDQREYQLELQRNYNKVKEKLLPLVSSTISTGTLKKKHKREKDHRKSHIHK